MNRRGLLLSAASAPVAGLAPREGAQLPLDLPFLDSDGRALRLRDLFAGARAVLLVPGYYACAQLCGLLMHALLEGLQRSGAPADQYRVVAFSLDPSETVQAARSRRESDLAFARFAARRPRGESFPELHLLLGQADSTARLAQSLGVRFAAAGGGIVHPALVAVASPRGRICAYLPGLEFPPADLRAAIATARGGALAGLGERIAMLCSLAEPTPGSAPAAVMNTARALGVATAAGLAAWCWRRRGGGRKE